MSLDQFRQLFQQAVSENEQIFSAIPPDKKADESEISEFERKIGKKIPSSLRIFLKEFGGGEFGFLNIFSFDSNSDNFIENAMSRLGDIIPESYIPISDDYCGGYYLVKVGGEDIDESVYYWNSEDGLSITEFENALDFIARYAWHTS